MSCHITCGPYIQDADGILGGAVGCWLAERGVEGERERERERERGGGVVTWNRATCPAT